VIDNLKNDLAITPTISKNPTQSTIVLKNSDFKESGLQQPQIDLKPINVISGNPISSKDSTTSDSNVNKFATADLEVLSKVKTGQLPKDFITINSEVNQKLETNKTDVTNDVSVLKSGFKKEFIPKIQNEIIPELKASTQKTIIATESNNLTSKHIRSEYMVNSNTKTVSVKSESNSNYPEIEKLSKSNAEVKQILEVKENEIIQPGKTISFRSNQKITAVSINKDTLQDKAGLSDLIGKTNVKEIDVNIQKYPKSISANTSKIQSDYKPELISLKENITKSEAPVLIIDAKKVLSTNPELKQQVVKNTNESEKTKTEKSLSFTIEEKPNITKTEISTRIIDNAKVQNTTKSSSSQELFTEKNLFNNEKSAGAIFEKSVLPKTESNKTSANNQQAVKENAETASNEKIKVENKNLEPVKTSPVESLKLKPETNITEISRKSLTPEITTEQKPVEVKSNLQKTFIENELVKSEKSVLPKIELNKTSANNQQAIKENAGTASNEKIKVENKNLEPVKASPIDSPKLKSESNVSETSRKSLTPEIKTEQKPVEVKSNFHITEDETTKIQNKDSVKEVGKNSIKESVKEGFTLKTNTDAINKESEKAESKLSNNSEIALKNIKERSAVENLRKSLIETVNNERKPESVTKNQAENKNIKVDFMQRRVYSQIPHLEVMVDETEVKSVKNSVLNIETNKQENTQSIDEPVKSRQNQVEQNTKNEKQVWVKVSLEKHDNESVSEVRKSSNQQSKITIDVNSDDMKKDFEQNTSSEKESREYSKSKPQTVQVETSKNTEVKNVIQNQTTSTQQDLAAGLKPEIKTENNPFKSALHSEDTKFSSRAAEMVEKIKVISSGEMVREISKVFESGEKQSIILRLVPKELGSIKVMLDTIDNVLTAKVEVENETVGHIVRNNVEQLKQNLLQSGVHINSINISYHSSDQKQHGFNNQKRKNSGYLPENDIEEIDETIVSKKMGYNTYEYLA